MNGFAKGGPEPAKAIFPHGEVSLTDPWGPPVVVGWELVSKPSSQPLPGSKMDVLSWI